MTGLISHPSYGVSSEIPDLEPQSSESVLESIRRRETLRVGVLPNHLPFAFNNPRQELVGFEVEMAYLLARSLGVQPEFYPVNHALLPELLNSGTVDIAMTGLAITPQRAATLMLSDSYLDETLAFVVRDHLRDKFSSWERIRSLGLVRVGIPNVPYYIQELRERLPELLIEIAGGSEQLVDNLESYDAVVLPAERGSVITFLYPEYSSVVPGPDIVRVPLAYPLARSDSDWANFVNRWIELKQKDASVDRLYKYWILGQGAVVTINTAGGSTTLSEAFTRISAIPTLSEWSFRKRPWIRPFRQFRGSLEGI